MRVHACAVAVVILAAACGSSSSSAQPDTGARAVCGGLHALSLDTKRPGTVSVADLEPRIRQIAQESTGTHDKAIADGIKTMLAAVTGTLDTTKFSAGAKVVADECKALGLI